MDDCDRLTELTTRAEALAAELTATVNAIRTAASAPATPPTEPVRPTLLTVDQAAEALCLSRSAVYSLMGSGELCSVLIGPGVASPSGRSTPTCPP
jgi:hypothetical protein